MIEHRCLYSSLYFFVTLEVNIAVDFDVKPRQIKSYFNVDINLTNVSIAKEDFLICRIGSVSIL